MPERLNFDDTTPEPIPFTYKQVDYELRPPTGSAAKQFNAARMRGVRMVDDKIEMADLADKAGNEIILVAACSYVVETGKGVSPAVVGEWPESMVSKLFTEAKRMGGFDSGDQVREQFGKAYTADQIAEARTLAEAKGLIELAKWLEPTEGEKAKNAQDSSDDGSS